MFIAKRSMTLKRKMTLGLYVGLTFHDCVLIYDPSNGREHSAREMAVFISTSCVVLSQAGAEACLFYDYHTL